MPTTYDKLMSMQALAGRVIRYHTHPVIRQETVAEHCWRVATLYCQLYGLPRAEILYYMLHHDSGEFCAGDLPFMAKRSAPNIKEQMDIAEASGRKLLNIELPELTKIEWARFKLCDMLQMLEYSMIEMLQGNQLARPVYDNILEALHRVQEDNCNPLSVLSLEERSSAILAVMTGIPTKTEGEGERIWER